MERNTLIRIARIVGAIAIVGILILVLVVWVAPKVRNAAASPRTSDTNVVTLQTRVNDLTTQLNAANTEAAKVPVLQAQVEDLTSQLAAARANDTTNAQTIVDLRTQLDEANANLANAQSAVASGITFDFVRFGNTQIIDMTKMEFPAWVTWRVGVEVPGGQWEAAAYFSTPAGHVSINRLICDDTCLKVVYYPAGGNPVTLLDKSANLDMFQMVWVGGDNSAALPTEVFNVMKARGVADEEILMQNVYALFLGDVSEGSWIEFTFADDPVLQVNKGSSISLTADTDQMTKNLDGSMTTEITYFVEGMEDFRWTDTSSTFTTP
jgi:hypothetical protein